MVPEAPNLTKLTQKQQTVLEYLHRYISEHRRSPFLREIQEACRIISYKSVIDRLNALERKGYIKRTPNKHRAIHLRKATRTPYAEEATIPAETGRLAAPEAFPPAVETLMPDLSGETTPGVSAL